jgi:D-alanine-D-alanine ligase
MRVLILHTIPPAKTGPDRLTGEFDLSDHARNIASVLDGSVACGIEGQPREILQALSIHHPDVVFNLCEAPLGRPDLEHHAAALFEWLGVRFTGSGSETLALCRRKDRTNAVLAAAGVSIPRSGHDHFPCIVKPVDEDGSARLDHFSVCETAEELARHAMPALVEEFLPGREFAVSLWGRDKPDNISIGETVFLNGLRLNTYAAKWHVESADFANSPMQYDSGIDPQLRARIEEAACGAWSAAGARHYIRVDVRCDRSGAPRVLDVNPNPEIGPGVGICRAVQEAGWRWEEFLRKLVEWA